MEYNLERLAFCAREVAVKADATQAKPSAMDALLIAMMDYRAVAICYLAHPSVGYFVKAQALKYDGDTREAIERIADLIDSLNQQSIGPNFPNPDGYEGSVALNERAIKAGPAIAP